MSNESITFESLASAYELDVDELKAEFDNFISKPRKLFKDKTGKELPSEYERVFRIKFLRGKQSEIRKDETATGDEYIGVVVGMGRVTDKSDFARNLGIRFYQQRPSEAQLAYKRPPYWTQKEDGKSVLIVPKYMADGKTKNRILIRYEVANGRAVIKNKKLVPLEINGKRVPVKWVIENKDGEPEVLETRQFFEEKDNTGKVTGYRYNDAFQKPIKSRFGGYFIFIGRKVESDISDLAVYWLQLRSADSIESVQLPPMNQVIHLNVVLNQKPTDLWGYHHGKVGTKQFHSDEGDTSYLIEVDKDVIADAIGNSTPMDLVRTHLANRITKFGIDSFVKAETRYKGVKGSDYASRASARFMISEAWVQEVSEGRNGANHRLVLETNQVGGENSMFTGWLTSSISASQLSQKCNSLIIYDAKLGWNNFAGKKIWSANILNFFADRSTVLIQSPDVDLSFDELEKLMLMNSNGSSEQINPDELDVADMDDMMTDIAIEEKSAKKDTKKKKAEKTKKAEKAKKAEKKEKIVVKADGDAELPDADTFSEWADDE